MTKVYKNTVGHRCFYPCLTLRLKFSQMTYFGNALANVDGIIPCRLLSDSWIAITLSPRHRMP